MHSYFLLYNLTKTPSITYVDFKGVKRSLKIPVKYVEAFEAALKQGKANGKLEMQNQLKVILDIQQEIDDSIESHINSYHSERD